MRRNGLVLWLLPFRLCPVAFAFRRILESQRLACTFSFGASVVALQAQTRIVRLRLDTSWRDSVILCFIAANSELPVDEELCFASAKFSTQGFIRCS